MRVFAIIVISILAISALLLFTDLSPKISALVDNYRVSPTQTAIVAQEISNHQEIIQRLDSEAYRIIESDALDCGFEVINSDIIGPTKVWDASVPYRVGIIDECIVTSFKLKQSFIGRTINNAEKLAHFKWLVASHEASIYEIRIEQLANGEYSEPIVHHCVSPSIVGLDNAAWLVCN